MKLFRLLRMVQVSNAPVLSGCSLAVTARQSGICYVASLILVVFMLGTNYAGVLSGTVSEGSQGNYNLTAVNTEWAVWGQHGFDSLVPSDRSAGSSGISDLTFVPATGVGSSGYLRNLGQFGDLGWTLFQWSDGTATPAASNVSAGIQYVTDGGYDQRGEGFSFTAIAGREVRKLTLFAILNDGQGKLTASLSDGSASPLSISTRAVNYSDTGLSNVPFMFEITYQAASANQTLNVAWTLENVGDTSGPNAAIQAVTLAEVPEPTSMAIFGLGALGVAYRARRKIKVLV